MTMVCRRRWSTVMMRAPSRVPPGSCTYTVKVYVYSQSSYSYTYTAKVYIRIQEIQRDNDDGVQVALVDIHKTYSADICVYTYMHIYIYMTDHGDGPQVALVDGDDPRIRIRRVIIHV